MEPSEDRSLLWPLPKVVDLGDYSIQKRQ
jgi:hypothetical protein